MSGPWEKYQKAQAAGPWTKYAQNDWEASTGSESNKSLPRRISEKIVDSPAMPAIGGVVGGIAGLPLGPGALGMAGLGGAAGESYRQVAARALGMDAPQTSLEASNAIGEEGAKQMLAEGLGTYVLGPIARMGFKSAGKVGKQLTQLITKVRPEDTQRVFDNPSSMLPGVMGKAKEAWSSAAEKAGIPQWTEGNEIDLLKKLKGGAEDFVTNVYEKLYKNEPVSAAEAQLAKQSIDVSLMPAAKTTRNKPLIALWSRVRDKFVNRIGEESPELASANSEMAKAFSAQKFKSLFPKNLDDSPALFRSALISGLGFSGENKSMPERALGAGMATLLGSPAAIGTGIALAGALSDPARVVAPIVGRTALGFAASKIKRRQ